MSLKICTTHFRVSRKTNLHFLGGYTTCNVENEIQQESACVVNACNVPPFYQSTLSQYSYWSYFIWFTHNTTCTDIPQVPYTNIFVIKIYEHFQLTYILQNSLSYKLAKMSSSIQILRLNLKTSFVRFFRVHTKK